MKNSRRIRTHIIFTLLDVKHYFPLIKNYKIYIKNKCEVFR